MSELNAPAVPASAPAAVPTQVAQPWRATVRTMVAAVVALLPILPAIVAVAGVESIPWVVSALAVAGGVTRVLAIPAVHDWVSDYVPWLAATPPSKS